jgi:hypothetical protein
MNNIININIIKYILFDSSNKIGDVEIQRLSDGFSRLNYLNSLTLSLG